MRFIGFNDEFPIRSRTVIHGKNAANAVNPELLILAPDEENARYGTYGGRSQVRKVKAALIDDERRYPPGPPAGKFVIELSPG